MSEKLLLYRIQAVDGLCQKDMHYKGASYIYQYFTRLSTVKSIVLKILQISAENKGIIPLSGSD